MSGNGIILPQGSLTTSDANQAGKANSVMIVTIVGTEAYVYTTSGFVPFSSVDTSTIYTFSIGVNTQYANFVTNGPSSASGLALYYDASGNVQLSLPSPSPIEVSMPISFVDKLHTSLEEPNGLSASILYSTIGYDSNGSATIKLNFGVAGINQTVNDIALLPTSYYSRDNSCIASSNLITILQLFKCTYFSPGQCQGLPSTAFTNSTSCSKINNAFSYASAGTYCTGNAYSVCPTPGDVCIRNAGTGLFGCQTQVNTIPNNSTVDITVHHNVTSTPSVDTTCHHKTPTKPCSGMGWIILVVIIVMIIIAAAIYFFFFQSEPMQMVNENTYSQGYMHGYG